MNHFIYIRRNGQGIALTVEDDKHSSRSRDIKFHNIGGTAGIGVLILYRENGIKSILSFTERPTGSNEVQ